MMAEGPDGFAGLPSCHRIDPSHSDRPYQFKGADLTRLRCGLAARPPGWAGMAPAVPGRNPNPGGGPSKLYGRTGIEDVQNVFHLHLAAVKPGARYALRTRVRSAGGSDSNGTIFLRIASPPP